MREKTSVLAGLCALWTQRYQRGPQARRWRVLATFAVTAVKQRQPPDVESDFKGGLPRHWREEHGSQGEHLPDISGSIRNGVAKHSWLSAEPCFPESAAAGSG